MPGPSYDRQHRAERAMWAPRVRAGEVNCWRCGRPIIIDPDIRGEGWDLGHRPPLPSLPEHARGCNRSKGGRLGADITNGRRVQPAHSRTW